MDPYRFVQHLCQLMWRCVEGSNTTLVVVDNDMVEALRVELAKCKSYHEKALVLGYLEHTNKVQGLKAWVEELTIFVRVNIEQQGLPTEDVIEGASRNSCGQGK